MDIVEAERNLKIYRTNINALNSIITDGMKYAEKEFISGMLRKYKNLEKNIEQAIFKKT